VNRLHWGRPEEVWFAGRFDRWRPSSRHAAAPVSSRSRDVQPLHTSSTGSRPKRKR